MKSSRFILVVAFAAAMQTQAWAQNELPTGVADLQTAMQEDEHFTRLMTEVWVLRDLLALQAGGDISADAQVFQGLQDQIRSQRASILETVSREPLRAQPADKVMTSVSNLASTLDSFGVRPDSDLGTQLITASFVFNQALSAASLGSLCDVHPFHPLCAS